MRLGRARQRSDGGRVSAGIRRATRDWSGPASPMEHHGGSFFLYLPYYLPVVIAGFFPWTLHLPGALSALVHGRIGGESGRRWFLGWIDSSVCCDESCRDETAALYRVHLAGPGVDRRRRYRCREVRGADGQGQGLAAGRSLVLWSRLPRLWFGADRRPLVYAGAGLTLVGCGRRGDRPEHGGLGHSKHLEDQPEKSAIILIVGMVVLQVPLQIGVLPALEQIKISPALARAVNAHADSAFRRSLQVRRAYAQFLSGPALSISSGPEGVLAWAAQTGPGILIIPSDRLDPIANSRAIGP